MTSNLSFRALMYALDLCTIVCRCTHACQESTCKCGIKACKLKAKDRVSLYKFYYVLRCDCLCDTRC